MGNRIAKYIYSSSGTLEKSIFYVRDASGNVMFGSSYSQRSAELEMPIPQQSDAGSVYENIAEGGANILTQTELHIYGSSRLGLVNLKDNELIDVPDPTDVGEFELERGRKSYELSNHLGNVLSIVTDNKIPIPDATETTIEFYTAVVISYTDYYPFGAPMAERSWQGDYRYGFNGKELDSEGMGGGSSTNDYGLRIYNPALAKFLSVDPLMGKYPELTPYQFASNRPIDGIDLDGAEYENYLSTKIVETYGVEALSVINYDHGWGPLVKADYNLQIKSNIENFNAFKEAYSTNPGIIHNPSNDLATYYPMENATDDNSILETGDHMYIDIAGPFNGYVRFTDVQVSEYEFEISAATLFGHTDAGTITFKASIDPATGIVDFNIHNETTNNIGIDAATQHLGRLAQTSQWKTVMDNAEKFLGGNATTKEVYKEIMIQDAEPGDGMKVVKENLVTGSSSEEYKEVE